MHDNSKCTVILLELYEDGQGQYWVRFVFNGKELQASRRPTTGAGNLTTTSSTSNRSAEGKVPPLLSTTGQPVEQHLLCPYEEWKELAAQLTPTDYEKECQQHLHPPRPAPHV